MTTDDNPLKLENTAEQAAVVKQYYDGSIRYIIEMPDRFAVAHWPRDADVATIARCILATLKYEPHAADTTALRRALEGLIEQPQAARDVGDAR